MPISRPGDPWGDSENDVPGAFPSSLPGVFLTLRKLNGGAVFFASEMEVGHANTRFFTDRQKANGYMTFPRPCKNHVAVVRHQ